MNWLAHSLLSKKDIDYQLGNILADPLKGVAWPGASQPMVHGMRMHRAIDKFTDKHPVVSTSKSRLGDDGHLKGVVLDLLYDHFLSQSWDVYSAIELDQFLLVFNQQALATSRDYPDRAKTIVGRMAATNLLGQYKSFDDLIQALRRIDSRLSVRVKVKETATQYIPVLEQEYRLLKTDFDLFFPQLINFFKSHQLGGGNNHYLL